MSRKIQVRLIMQLRAAGLSQSEIARTHHMSKSSVSEVFSIAQERQISFSALENLSHEECYRLFFPDREQPETTYSQPDYAAVHRELPRTGVTLKLLWKEYRDRCKLQSLLPYGYSRFCSSKRTTSLPFPPLRTVRESFPSHGSSLSKASSSETRLKTSNLGYEYFCDTMDVPSPSAFYRRFE